MVTVVEPDDASGDTSKIVDACKARLGNDNVAIGGVSDIEPGSGLGGSSAFAVGVIHALTQHNRIIVGRDLGNIPPEYLARKACEIEIKDLGSPIGKQDQYAASYGGFNRCLLYTSPSPRDS